MHCTPIDKACCIYNSHLTKTYTNPYQEFIIISFNVQCSMLKLRRKKENKELTVVSTSFVKRNSKIEKYLQLRVGCRDVTENKKKHFCFRRMRISFEKHGSYLFLLFAFRYVALARKSRDKTF